MRLRVFLAAVFLFPMAAWAQVTTFELDNGMKAVVIEDHRAPVVTHMVWYKVGAADEPPGKSGIAHFLEHLMFKGTEKLASNEFSQIIAANGGSENAFTSYDYTAYFQRVAADRLELMMTHEADRMQGLTLTEEEVLPERDVIIEERNQRTDSNPNALFAEHRRALSFRNHPYGIPIVGWRHEIETLSRQDAIDFYKTYYAPNNAILIVAGDVDPAEVRRLAEIYYGPLEPSSNLPDRIRPQEPPYRAPIRTTYRDARVAQPYLVRTYVAPQRKTGDQKDAAALVILAQLLGGSGITSVLGQELQLKEHTLGQSAFYTDISLDQSSFGLYAAPVPGLSLEDVEDLMDEAIAKFMKDGVDQDHLARIKKQIEAEQIYQRDDLAGLARYYGQAMTSGLSVSDIDEWPSILQSITGEDVMLAAQNVFNLDASVTGYMMGEDQ